MLHEQAMPQRLQQQCKADMRRLTIALMPTLGKNMTASCSSQFHAWDSTCLRVGAVTCRPDLDIHGCVRVDGRKVDVELKAAARVRCALRPCTKATEIRSSQPFA